MKSTLLGIADDKAFGGSVRVIVTRPKDLARAKNAVDRLLQSVDLAASRFREDSELSRLNAAPAREVVVSPLLASLLAAALRGAKLTNGAVDPTIGQAVRLSGYDRDFAKVPPSGNVIHLTATPVPGWEAIQFSERYRTLRTPRGVEIDLGATAKALAADLAAAAAIDAVAGGGVLVSLGGDIAVAGEPPQEGWLVQTSEDSGAPIDDAEETISIRSGGIATSSTTVRRWTRGLTVLHHIIDPATGLPAGGPWRTASVVAATCCDANIASTAAIVMGDRAVAWLESQRLPTRLVDRRGSIRRVAGWPAPEHRGEADPKQLRNNF
jgi:thiamine biosynthesis lipoprotein ApbE